MGVSRKQSKPNFPENEHFLPPDTHTYVCVSGGKKYSFFVKFGALCSFGTPVLRFVLLPYYRRTIKTIDKTFFCIATECSGVFRTQLNVYDGAFSENS